MWGSNLGEGSGNSTPTASGGHHLCSTPAVAPENEDAWIAHHPYHRLGSRIVLQLGIDDQVLELFSLKPFGKKNDLAACCRYKVRDNVVLGNRVKKSGSMRVETAKPGKGKCRRHNTTSQTAATSSRRSRLS